MKKTLLLLLLSSFLYNISAQEISFTPNPVLFEEIDANLEQNFLELNSNASIKNEGTETAEYGWIKTVEFAPEEWEFAVHDLNLCYFPSVNIAPTPFTLIADEEATFGVYLYPRGAPGCGAVRIDLALWDDEGNFEVIYSVTYEFKVNKPNGCLTSLNDTHIENVNIHPNPITNSFKINGLENISDIDKIAIFNVTGKEVKSFKPNASEYNVGDLTAGLYFVQIFNQNERIGTKRIIIGE